MSTNTMSTNSAPVESRLLNVAILTHNALDYTRLCIKSLLETTKVPFNIFIVDNVSDVVARIVLGIA